MQLFDLNRTATGGNRFKIILNATRFRRMWGLRMLNWKYCFEISGHQYYSSPPIIQLLVS
jgi:hypothetical protein